MAYAARHRRARPPLELPVMFTLPFWAATAERGLKTFAQALLAVLGAGQIGILDVDWVAALSTAGMATVLSVLTSIASAGVGDGSGPSIGTETLNTREN